MQQFGAVFPQGHIYLIISPSFPTHTVSPQTFSCENGKADFGGGVVLKDIIYSFQNTEGVREGQFEIM